MKPPKCSNSIPDLNRGARVIAHTCTITTGFVVCVPVCMSGLNFYPLISRRPTRRTQVKINF